MNMMTVNNHPLNRVTQNLAPNNGTSLVNEDESIYDAIEVGIPLPTIGRGARSPERLRFTKLLQRMKPLNSLTIDPKYTANRQNAAKELGYKIATRIVEERGVKSRRVWLINKGEESSAVL
jgi:hypothetical protein